jgi:hypothetical protein
MREQIIIDYFYFWNISTMEMLFLNLYKIQIGNNISFNLNLFNQILFKIFNSKEFLFVEIFKYSMLRNLVIYLKMNLN